MIRRVNNAVSEKEGHFGTETEGEKQLRSIVDKQLDTKISLQQQLQQHKTFSHSGDFKEISERLSGKRTMKEFQLIEYLLEQKEELKNCGLTEEEINTYLSFLGKLGGKKRYLSMEPSIQKKWLKEIKEKICSHYKTINEVPNSSMIKQLTRQEMDIEKTLYAGCETKKHLQFLVTSREMSQLSSDDPFAYISCLAQQIGQKSSMISDQNEYDSHTKLQQKHSCSFSQNKKCCNVDCKTETDCEQEFDDVDSKTKTNLAPGKSSSEIKLCDKDLEIKESLTSTKNSSVFHVSVPLKEKEIRENKLSLDEIRKLPRFSDYHPGKESQVLFIKNLHPKVYVEELVALFSSFEPVKYRLLKGRMKGQAFIEFSSVEKAVAAQHLVTGYLLRGRPVIIEYGRGHQNQ
ncbi:RNA-binding protein 41-like isoform X2 [Limulus polyphemus]|nr:RNA-binding protein 41-like isoform X2 [Limulus polyphemus]XP_013780773.1 RNA-binding protein 41-like isoform X2 [Limulus polyphemus]